MLQRMPGPVASLLCATLLVACGGSPGSGPVADGPLPAASGAPPATTAPPAPIAPVGTAVLVSDTPSLALAVSGRSRSLRIHNPSELPAVDVAVANAADLPAGSTVVSDCGLLPPQASCTVTIVPGPTPSAAPGDTQAAPVRLRIAGRGTPVLEVAVQVLDYGSVYQGGYVFAIDDSQADAAGIGGKVLGLTRQLNMPWLADNTDTPISDPISTPDSRPDAATSWTDGPANTRNIVAYMQNTRQPAVAPQHYPAGLCDASTAADFDDWYLPATCELSYGLDSRSSACGSRDSPLLQNVQSALLDRYRPQALGELEGVLWWTSTEPSLSPSSRAYHYKPSVELWISQKTRSQGMGVACVRAITP